MANNKEKKQKRKATQFEKDERRSFIIAIIVCVVIVLVVTIALFAIYRNKRARQGTIVQETIVEETVQNEDAYSSAGNIVVINQQELDEALADSNNVEILFQTEESVAVTIAEADYPDLALTIDAPYADVFNYATFKSVTINRISANTWTENVSGNSFYISANSSHLIIAEGAQVTRIELNQPNSTMAIENDGQLDMLTLAADSTIVAVENNNTISQVVISKKTNLGMTGNTENGSLVDIGYDADGTMITTKVPMSITSYATVTVDYQEGAEGSAVTMKNNAKTTVVSNHMTEELTVIETDGTESKLEAGIEEKTYQTEAAAATSATSTTASSSSSSTTTSSLGSSGSSSTSKTYSGSSSSSSSGNKSQTSSTTTESKDSSTTAATSETKETKETSETKETTDKKYSEAELDQKVEAAVESAVKELDEKYQQMLNDMMLDKPEVIVSFEQLPNFDAGIYGSALNTTEIYSALPTTINGNTSNGLTVTFPVRGWIPDPAYSQQAPTGTYKFYAWLGTPEKECTVLANAEASVNIIIKSFENLTYETEEAKQIAVMKIGAREGNVDDVEEYYVATNTSENIYMVRMNVYYYDQYGNYLMDYNVYSEPYVLYPGQTHIFTRTTTAVDERIKAFTVGIDASPPSDYLVGLLGLSANQKLFDEKADLDISENYFMFKDPSNPEELNYGFDVTVRHDPSIKEDMTEVTVTVIYYDEGGSALHMESQTTGDTGESLYHNGGILGIGDNIQKGENVTGSVKTSGSESHLIFTYPKDSAEGRFFIFTTGGFVKNE